jgi:hypothetical protein
MFSWDPQISPTGTFVDKVGLYAGCLFPMNFRPLSSGCKELLVSYVFKKTTGRKFLTTDIQHY